MGASYHGKNGLIYVSGVELIGANAWTLNVATDSAEAPKFNSQFKDVNAGQTGWSGSVNAWDQGDSKTLFSAATAGIAVALLIYPVRTTLGNYYSGNAIFGMSADGGVAANVARNGDFVGTGTLAATGFTA